MVKYTMHQLNSDRGCNKRRQFTYEVKERKTENFYKAVAVKKAVKAIVGGASVDEAIEEMGKVFDEIPYQKTQREILKKDSERNIRRYLAAESRTLLEAVPATIQVSPDMEVVVTPDFLVMWTPEVEGVDDFVTKTEEKFDPVKKKVVKTTHQIHIDGTIEIIRLQSGKQTSFKTIKEIKEDIGLYSMLLYARKFVEDGSTVLIKANYYFLRRNDDNFSAGTFKPFDDAQIFGIEEVYEGKPNETDEKFQTIIKEYINGHDEFECDPKDCEKCVMYDVCKGYAEAPLPVEREVSTKVGTIILNDLQKQVTDY